MLRLLASAASAAALITAASSALAEPQWNVGVVPGVSGAGARSTYWQATRFYGGLRGDLLLGRSRSSDAGIGPFADLATVGFDDLRLGAGASVLLPISRSYPLVPSAGGYVREGGHGWEPGLSAWVFFGLRGHNFHSSYSMANGLLVGVQRGLGETHENAIVIAAQLDGLILSLPLLLGYQWLAN